jgi:hypothetical protein
MSTLGAMLLVVIVAGMLLAYYLGYSLGRHEGYEQGHQQGKREGAVRAYAVGYDRGRHDRKVKQSEAEEAAAAEAKPRGSGCLLWLLPLLVALLAIILAAVSGSLRKGP